jgi:hypothetical protein
MAREPVDRWSLRPFGAAFVSFPKCGRTWVRLMLGRLLALRRGFAERADDLDEFDVYEATSALEATSDAEAEAGLARMAARVGGFGVARLLQQKAAANAYAIAWQAGDLALIDNSRVMRARGEVLDPERRILARMCHVDA